EILQAGWGENIYYTNSSQIPVDHTDDPFEALLLQDDLQCKYTGGTVLHLYMGERLSSPEACRNFVRTVISNFKLPYITVTQGVVLSGGECTMHPSIVKLLEEIKQMGFAIKIDTNGSRPQTLHTLISKGLVDYVALDF